MSHDTHTTDSTIRELTIDGCTVEMLRKMAKGWKGMQASLVREIVAQGTGRYHGYSVAHTCSMTSHARRVLA